MEEKDQNESKLNTEEIKKEAADTVNQVKDSIKNTDIKKDANEAKGFFSQFIKNPIKELENVAHVSGKNNFLKIAIILLVIWLISCFLNSLVSAVNSYQYYVGIEWFFKNSISNVLNIIKDIIAPVLSVVILSGIIYFVAKGKKKPFINIAVSVIIAQVPVVIASVINLLDFLGSDVYKLTNAFSSFCFVISTIFVYFTSKFLCEEEKHDAFIKKFALIMGIFYIAKFVFSFLGIYI